MKNNVVLFLLLFLSIGAVAQNITVKSFKDMPMDMSASSLEGKRIDHNGAVAALIKIVSTETGFSFDGGTLGIVDSKQKVGEIWLWVPYGSRKLTIVHPQLGVLSDYYYPIEIKAEHTYEMVLNTAHVETVINEVVNQQYLVFQVSPSNAKLEVGDEVWELGADGMAMKFVNFNEYTYRVQAPGYEPDAGKIIVNDPNNAHKVTVTLHPIYGSLTIESTPGNSKIFIDGKEVGTTPKSIQEMLVGQHQIKLSQEGYIDYVETITVNKGEAKQVRASLLKGKMIQFKCNVPSAQLEIDGQKMGSANGNYQLTFGQHNLRATANGFSEYSANITVTEKTSEIYGIAMQDNSTTDEVFAVGGVFFTMKFVQGGSFWMGAPSDVWFDYIEKPSHKVTLSDFYMGETEVTQELWQAVMGSKPSVWREGDDFPVEEVSWDDCQVFIRKLNQMTGKNFRLPTEAEWEYAAQGGKKGKDYSYAGSNDIDKVAWYSGNSNGQTHAVKGMRPNGLGLYDMSGNVAEWTGDYYAMYDKKAQTNPTGPEKGNGRVYRGGDYQSEAGYCRVLCRSGIQHHHFGFRLSRPK